MERIERVPIPTPFSVGRVNCYLLGSNGHTVIDPGPATAEAYETLTASLARNGTDVTDVDRVLITHPHMDHFGLVSRLVDESGATVLAHADATDRLDDPIEHFEREQAYFDPFLRSMGMPEHAVDTVLELPEPYTNYQQPVDVTRTLTDGDVLDAGVELSCLSTPGHAPGSLCFHAESEDVLFTGDHVLPTITPNPLLTLVPGTDDERTRSLPTYLDSLRRILDIDVDRGYGGHGEPLSDVGQRTRETIEHHHERKESIADVIDADGPVTAYEIMEDLFPDLPATEMFSGMSEAIGHLDLLEDENRVEITEDDGVLRYDLVR